MTYNNAILYDVHCPHISLPFNLLSKSCPTCGFDWRVYHLLFGSLKTLKMRNACLLASAGYWKGVDCDHAPT